MLKVGNVELKNNTIAAPIAGFSDVGFRRQCAKLGAGLTVTEMVSAKGLVYGNENTDGLLKTSKEESVTSIQLFGSDPEFMYKAAQHEKLKKFDIIDINMGCPVRKVFNNGDGSALMLDIEKLKDVVRATVEGANRPVTVKMRAGIKEGKILAPECAYAAQEAGASLVTIHPRFREQFYAGVADHTITKLVKESVFIPVVASGDIVDLDSFEKIKEISHADGFMIGRGALGNPNIFNEINHLELPFNKLECIKDHINTLLNEFSERYVYNAIKLHLCYYAKGQQNAKQVRLAICNIHSIEDIYKVVEEYFYV